MDSMGMRWFDFSVPLFLLVDDCTKSQDTYLAARALTEYRVHAGFVPADNHIIVRLP